MRHSYLGLDLGTFSGFALLDLIPGKGSSCLSGTWDCSIKQGHDSPSLRTYKFARHLQSIFDLGVTKVGYELVRRHNGVLASHVYGALLDKMQSVCDSNGVPYEGFNVGTIKKFATGRGNASKAEMIAAAEMLGFQPKDDNEADAIHIARLCAEMSA